MALILAPSNSVSARNKTNALQMPSFPAFEKMSPTYASNASDIQNTLPPTKKAPLGGLFLNLSAELAAVIHQVFNRVRCVLELVHIFPFQPHVTLDHILGKNVTRQQEVVIILKTFQGFAQ